MTSGLMRTGLVLLSLGAVVSGRVVLAPEPADPVRPRAPKVPEPKARGEPAGVPADSVLQAIARRAPFRATRTPPAVAYDPDRPTLTGTLAPVPSVQRPVPMVSGIVWGAEPAAVLEGLPGTDGPRVLRVGEVVSGLRVKRIRRDAVVIAGLDTTWTLPVRVPWK